MLPKKPYVSIIYATLLIGMIFSSCDKEYSCEGGCAGSAPDTTIINPPDTTTIPFDTVANNPLTFPTCDVCRTTTPPDNSSPWSLKIGGSTLCGLLDTAIVTPERNAFTFFGPCTCGTEQGLIFTVYLSPSTLTSDQTNLVAPFASFIYYHSNSDYYLSSRTAEPFHFVISSYDHATKLTTGSFNGVAYKLNGTSVIVHSGSFKIKLI